MRRIGARVGMTLAFSALWLASGFVVGTAVLLGPVHWMTEILRWLHAGASLERFAVGGVILAVVLASSMVAAFLLTWIRRSDRTWSRVAVAAVTIGATALALWAWMTPRILTDDRLPPEKPESRFILGPYPTDDVMRHLAAAGYTGVISLLHPAVVPFEPMLLREEQELAGELGLEFVHAPMVPWISDNRASMAKIRQVARRDTGHFLVHSYLGRERVDAVGRLLEAMGYSVGGQGSETPVTIGPADGGATPGLAAKGALARGRVFTADEAIYLTPLPTVEEHLRYFLDGDIRSVVSILDPGQPRERTWIAWEERSLTRHAPSVGYRHIPIKRFPPDPCALRTVSVVARELPRPVAVHGFMTGWSRSRLLLRAFRGEAVYPVDVPAGRVWWMGDSIYVGPAMVEGTPEYELLQGGVRGVVAVLDPSDPVEDSLLDAERVRLRDRDVALRAVPLSSTLPDIARAIEVVDVARALPRPVYVHGRRADEPRLAAVRAAFRKVGVAATCPKRSPSDRSGK